MRDSVLPKPIKSRKKLFFLYAVIVATILSYFLVVEEITDIEDIRVFFVTLFPHRRKEYISPIPKIIWQTYKTEDIPLASWKCVRSWKRFNPGWEYRFVDDAGMAEFIRSEYDDEMYAMWASVPVGVMKADMWRYLVVYKYGGFYSDLDARCRDSLDDWLPNGKSFVVGLENDEHICQWAFAGVAGHPLLKSVIDTIRERFREGVNTANPHFVHHYTGPGVWTEGIKRGLGMAHLNAKGLKEAVDGGDELAERLGLAVFEEDVMRWDKVDNLNASNQWLHYDSWVSEAHEKTGSKSSS